MLLRQLLCLAFSRALAKTGKRIAAKMAMEMLEVDTNLIPMLDAKAAQALYVAQAEERDNSPMTIAPNISMYTR